jgi:6-phosphogluconolactonase
MVSHVVVDETPRLAEVLAAILESEAAEAMAARSSCAIALSGGSIAPALFPRLAQARVDWSRTDFFWVDERAVAPDHADSNYGAARGLWLEPASVPAARVHRMPADGPDLAAAAALYERQLAACLGIPPRLDLALMGVGPDGHVASLFPGHALLHETARWVAAVEDAPKPPPRRLTLTLPVLAASRHVVVAAFGPEKAEAIREALEAPASSLPLAVLLRRAERSTVLLDPAAARRSGESDTGRSV